MSEEEYQAARNEYFAVYQGLARLSARDWPGAPGSLHRAIAIHRAELEINQKRLKLALTMRNADPQPGAPDSRYGPLPTRRQFYETEIEQAQKAIAENEQTIADYSRRIAEGGW
jgi:hypothetical protein